MKIDEQHGYSEKSLIPTYMNRSEREKMVGRSSNDKM